MMLEKASRILLDAASHLAVLQTHAEPTLTAIRSEAVKTLDTMLHCLAVANQTYFSTGFGRNLEELLALPVRPDDIEEQISTIVESQQREAIIEGASSLLGSIRALLLSELHSSQPGRSCSELFTAYYPEIKGGLNKLYSACRTGNRYLAVSAAVTVQYEVAQFLHASEGESDGFSVLSGYADYESAYDRHGLPDLVGLASAGDLGKLRKATDVFDRMIRELIRTHGVALNEVTSPEEMTDQLWNAP